MKQNFKKVLSLSLALLLLFTLVPTNKVNASSEEQNPEFKLNSPNPDFENFNKFRPLKSSSSKDKNGLKPSPLKILFDERNTRRRAFKSYRQNTLPSSFDLRDYSRSTAMRNQGPNGSCWAFATYASLESTLLPELRTDFSEKHLRNTHGFDWGPDDGGNKEISTAYLSRWSGPISEADDPYHPTDFYSIKNLDRAMDIYKVNFIPNKSNGYDVDHIKREIYNNGAMYTSVNGDEKYTNFRTMGHYFSGGAHPNHAVTIIGWDDDYSKYNFKDTPASDGAFLVKNSWGRNWGNQGGYYWVSYHDAHLGKDNAQFFAREKGRSDNIYQHDEFGATNSGGYNNRNWFSNVFGPVKKTEYVNSIGFWTVEENVSYEIYLVDKFIDTDSFQDRVKVASGKIRYPGYHLIDIEPVKISKGRKFAPIVYINGQVPLEQPYRNYASGVSANKGESYISSTGKKWDDITEYYSNTNVCVKAMTTDKNSDEIKVESVKLNKTRLSLVEGDTFKLEASIEPKDATNKDLIWKSSDRTVAVVSKTGIVKAIKKGRATITVETVDGALRDRSYVLVSEKEDTVKPDEKEDEVTREEVLLSLKSDKETYIQGDGVFIAGNLLSKDGKALSSKDISIKLTGPTGRESNLKRTTDYRGDFNIRFRSGKSSPIGKYTLIAEYVQDNNSYKKLIEFTLKSEKEEKEPSLDFELSVKDSVISKGSNQWLYVTARDENSKLVSSLDLEIFVKLPNSRTVKFKRTTNSSGKAELGIATSYKLPSGKYTFIVRGNASDGTRFQKEISFRLR